MSRFVQRSAACSPSFQSTERGCRTREKGALKSFAVPVPHVWSKEGGSTVVDSFITNKENWNYFPWAGDKLKCFLTCCFESTVQSGAKRDDVTQCG